MSLYPLIIIQWKKGEGDKSILSDILGHLNHTNTDVETWMEEVKFQFEFEIQFNLDIFFLYSYAYTQDLALQVVW